MLILERIAQISNDGYLLVSVNIFAVAFKPLV